jgi:hypothetical protein
MNAHFFEDVTSLLFISKDESIIEKIFSNLFDKEGADSRIDVKQDASPCGLEDVIVPLHGTKRLRLFWLHVGVGNEKFVSAEMENLVLVEKFQYDHVQALHFRTGVPKHRILFVFAADVVVKTSNIELSDELEMYLVFGLTPLVLSYLTRAVDTSFSVASDPGIFGPLGQNSQESIVLI